MKTNFISMIIAGCFSSLIFISCQSHEPKTDDAFEAYKQEKMLSNDSDTVNHATISVVNKQDVVKKDEAQDPWTVFETETQKKIAANEVKIKAIKNNPNANAKLISKATHLEKDNSDLTDQMNAYNEDEKARWEKFKTKMNQDVSDIGAEIKDMTVNDKK